MAASILVVEDDRASRDYLRLLLEKEGFETTSVANGVEAMVALESRPYDLVLSDIRMPQMDGMELLSRVKQRWPELQVVLISADTDLANMIEAVQIGAINYIVKPASPAAVIDAVRRSLTPRALPTLDNRSIPEIVGSCKEIVEIRHLVSLATRADVSVILTGERGTGRALTARTIHRYSCLAAGPFVRNDCAASRTESFESHFFGHRRGAFDGADVDKPGLLRQADGGVLYLENLDALSSKDQAELLRAIEACEVKPLGGNAFEGFSVRFIASMSDDPRELIAQNTLREDLYYRLRGFEIHLPSLRNRPEDIPLLARHLIDIEPDEMQADALELLSQAPWAENVDQLRAVLEAAKESAGDDPIAAQHIPSEMLGTAGLATTANGDAEPAIPPNTTLRDLERRAIIQAMKDCLGNRSKAARVLGIDRSTLRRKIAEFEIEDGV